MTTSDQNRSTALVTGASRGFGRAIASALHAEGAQVVAVARHAEPLSSLRDELGDRLTPVVADVADPVVAGALIEQHRPDALVLNAGAAPLLRPLQHHTWETFSRTWDVDVRQAFHWIREALLLPLRPGSTVVALSSGAAVAGYAHRDGLDVREFLDRFGPTLTPEDVGKTTVGLVTSDEQPPGPYLLTAAGLTPLG